MGLGPILPPGPRAGPGAQVIACSGGSAAGPPVGPQSLGPRSPGWRCSPGGQSAAPGGQGQRDVVLYPGPHLALAEVWTEPGGLPTRGLPPRVHREARASSSHTGSSQTQAEPTELKKGIQGGGQKRPLRITLSVGTAGPGHRASCLLRPTEGRKDILGGIGGAAPHQLGKKGPDPPCTHP